MQRGRPQPSEVSPMKGSLEETVLKWGFERLGSDCPAVRKSAFQGMECVQAACRVWGKATRSCRGPGNSGEWDQRDHWQRSPQSSAGTEFRRKHQEKCFGQTACVITLGCYQGAAEGGVRDGVMGGRVPCTPTHTPERGRQEVCASEQGLVN